MKLVLDTNIIISGILWGGNAVRILDRIETGNDLLFTSRAILVELDRVLAYPKIDRELRRVGLTRQNVIAWVVENSTLVVPRQFTDTLIEDDPSDDKFLECAISAGVDFLVTGDKKHLLPVRSHRGVIIVSAKGYLDRIKQGETSC